MICILEQFFTPRSIAVVGASRNPHKIGNVIIKNLIDGKYKGNIYPINPKANKILKYPCYPSLTSVRNPIDLAVISVPASIVLDVLNDCVKKNIHHVLMITAGFGEIGNTTLEQHVKTFITAHDIRLIGPNCLGIINTDFNLDTIFLPKARLKRPPKGGVAVVCQSGALGSILIDIMGRESIGLSKFISYGNALDVSESDLIDYLSKDSSTKVISLYIEGIKDGKHFLKTTTDASKKKPIVAIKGGTSEKGAEAVASHTAALAGSGAVYHSAFKQAGVIVARSLEELHDFTHIFEKTPKPQGKRVQVITNGGGYGILCVDALEQYEIPLANMKEETRTVIKDNTSPEAVIHNPIDLTGAASTEHYKIALDSCMNDSNIDIILLVLLMQTPLVTPDIIPYIEHLTKTYGKPIVALMPGGSFIEMHRGHLEEIGIATYTYPSSAVSALHAFCDYYIKKK